MAITFGAVTTATPTFSWNGSEFEANISHTLESGSTQIAVELHGPVGGTVSAVQWGGASLTVRADQDDGNNGRCRYYDRDAPSSGTANIKILVNVDMTGAGVTIFGISGVDTGTPRRTVATAGGFSGTASVAVTTVAGDVVVGAASTVNSATIDGSMTALYSNLLSGEYGSVGYRTASGTSTTVQWTQTSNNWAVVAVPYIPASGDTTAPTLSSPTGSPTGTTTATVGATTDEGNGTLYAVVTASATQPSVAQIKAGQNHLGASATWGGNQAISSTGAKTFSVTGLTTGTTYYAHFVHTDAATNNSAVSSTAGFVPGYVLSVTPATLTPVPQSISLNLVGQLNYTLVINAPATVTPSTQNVTLASATPVSDLVVTASLKNIALLVTMAITPAVCAPVPQSVALTSSGQPNNYTLTVTPVSPTITPQDVALNPSYALSGSGTSYRQRRRVSYATRYFSRG